MALHIGPHCHACSMTRRWNSIDILSGSFSKVTARFVWVRPARNRERQIDRRGPAPVVQRSVGLLEIHFPQLWVRTCPRSRGSRHQVHRQFPRLLLNKGGGHICSSTEPAAGQQRALWMRWVKGGKWQHHVSNFNWLD